MANKKKSSGRDSYQSNNADKINSPTDLLIETIRSGVSFMESLFTELKRVKEDTSCVACQVVPKHVTDEFSRVSKKILEILNFKEDSNETAVSISREEFDALKLEVIKLKSQVADLSKDKTEE